MSAPVRRAYGGLDRAEVVTALTRLARRVGVARVTMRALAAELGAAAPSVYYYVPGKAAALALLAEAVLAEIPEPQPGPWDRRLVELYCNGRHAILGVPGLAAVLQNGGGGDSARRLDQSSRRLLVAAGLTKASVAPAHVVLYTYLLGSVSLEEFRPGEESPINPRTETRRFRAGLDVIVAGIRQMAENS